ncbi:MAG: SufS family cysteine desulfurase [Bacteroidota bacterium]
MKDARPGLYPEPGLAPTGTYYFLHKPSAAVGIMPPRSTEAADEVAVRRKDFPILEQRVNGHPLIWLDNAATTQKPLAVLDALDRYYREYNSNVHRGAHTLADRATEAYENARGKAREMLGAGSNEEIVFVRGTTEAINLVAQTHGRMKIGRGDEILVSGMEHHSNIVPWQHLCQATGAVIKVIPLNDQGEILLDEYERLLARRPRLVAVTHVSNVLGTINPIQVMSEMAHYYGARILVDGAQAVPHLPVNVTELDADFYAFSGHKTYGPTGIGVLYGKKALLEEMPPWQGGGGMIQRVGFDETTYNALPHKFEAGTGNIADAVGLGAALDYLGKIGLAKIEAYEGVLTGYALGLLGKVKGLRLIGAAPFRAGVISFVVDGISPQHLAERLDQRGIAVRVGHHCAQPLMDRSGLKETIRVSLGLYHTEKELDVLADTINRAVGRGL